MAGQIGKRSKDIVSKSTPNYLRISPLGVHVSLQFNELHLAIIRTVLHCQIKRMSKQPYLNIILSEIWKPACELIAWPLNTSYIATGIKVRKFLLAGCKTRDMGQPGSSQLNLNQFQFFLRSTNMLTQLIHKLTFPL